MRTAITAALIPYTMTEDTQRKEAGTVCLATVL